MKLFNNFAEFAHQANEASTASEQSVLCRSDATQCLINFIQFAALREATIIFKYSIFYSGAEIFSLCAFSIAEYCRKMMKGHRQVGPVGRYQ